MSLGFVFKPLFPYIFGGLIRIVLIFCNERATWISSNVAITTPLNSWKRVIEGISLYRKGLSPYSGDIYHESPILLVLFDFVTSSWEYLAPFLFVICDLLTALALSNAGQHFAKDLLDKQNERKNSPDSKKLLLRSSDIARIRHHVAVVFLFHPYSLLACMAMTTTVFHNLSLALVLFFTSRGNNFLMSVFAAVASYQSLYPAMLLLPCAQFIVQKSPKKSRGRFLPAVLVNGLVYLISVALLLFASTALMGNWNFLQSVYGCILEARDLTPNIGLFWYFFTEMFEHFREYFICAFQINSFIYVIPLMLKFRNNCSIVIFTLLGLMCIFKSYPSVGDIALYTSLLPLWSHLYPNMRQTFIVGCFFLTCSVVGPVLYYLWIYAGSANANFFFGTTLAFNVAQIFLITDILFAHIKREYYIIHGPVLQIDGKPGKLILK